MTERELDPYGRELERRRALEEWKARKRHEAEHQERASKQRQLEAYLKRRGEDYMNHTGEQPTLNDLATWRREYMDEIEAEYQRARQQKLQEAERLYGF